MVYTDPLKAEKWRRGWDSNPRSTCADSGFQDRRTSPLCDLSVAEEVGFEPT